jgi:hypothetical protein
MQLVDRGSTVSSRRAVGFGLHSRGGECEYTVTIKVFEQRARLHLTGVQRRLFAGGRACILAEANQKPWSTPPPRSL